MTKVGELTESASSNTRLVQECLAGKEAAWAALINKYKNLIFSVPLKYGLSQEDAADVFQAVCLDLLMELTRLRNPEALPAWLISAAHHRSLRSSRRQKRFVEAGNQESSSTSSESSVVEFPEQAVRQIEQRQMLHQALSALPPRCRQLVEMLFFETPTRPYREISEIFGVARGSIGFIRGRCLERLRRRLEKVGFYWNETRKK
jgi:RNA polymerase sigma factor (sigma-70 family)